ncbi:Ger(x)C family spore germination protein [Alkalibacillus salilacus]|uniref:Spore germination protein n=1 Tax=Alkalibacillus salilacus TaxID=284582 RepID=A0ABT9VG00_9BACI|nr:Ger(x)C family spore germination protein [Alkalibacillus salilacus]MDQ0159891.1 spore germination protein [Alkalibacillus salilacus]
MVNNRKIIFVFISLLSLMIIPGCGHSKNVIEELGVASAYGLDINEQQQLDGTTVLYQFNPDITNASQIIRSTGETFSMVRSNANKKSGYKIVNGKLDTILFGPTIAKQGIVPYLDTIERDAAISNMLYVTMSEEPARDILSASNYEEAPNIGVYLHSLVDKSVRNEEIVSSTFHEFMRSYYRAGREPLVPIISIKENKASIDKVGIMHGDTHVGNLSLDEVFLVRLIRDKFQSGRINLEMDIEPFKQYIEESQHNSRKDQMYVVLDKLKNNTQIKLTNVDDLTYKVNVNLNARIIETSQQMTLENPKVVKILEQQINKKLEEDLKTVLKKSQQINSDVFGFGVKYNNHTRGEELTREQWQDLFPNIEVDYNVSTEIKRFGTVN